MGGENRRYGARGSGMCLDIGGILVLGFWDNGLSTRS